MKKRKLLLGALMMGVVVLSSCDKSGNLSTITSTSTPTSETSHEHTYATEWSKNETKHWHAATCGHDVKNGEADHTWNNGVETTSGTKFTCTVCGYEKTETSKYQVSEAKWKENLNNTSNNYTMVGTVTQGNSSMQQYVYLTESGMLSEVEDYKELFSKENDKYYLYKLSSGQTEWSKEEITEEEYNRAYNNYSANSYFRAFVNEYSKFTYNLETKKYTLASLDISDIASSSSDCTTLLTNISIGFEDDKLSSLNFTMTMNGSSNMSFQIAAKNFGTTTITIPTNIHEHTYATEWSKNETKHWHAATCGHNLKKDEADHTFDKGVADGNYVKYSCTVCGYSYNVSRFEVDEKGWKYAFDNSKMTNYTAVISNGDMGTGTVTYKHCEVDDKIISYLSYPESTGTEIYVKNSSTVTAYIKCENGDWVKYELAISGDIDEQMMEGLNYFLSYEFFCPNFGEFYDKFTYSNNSLSYNFVGKEGSNEIKTNDIFELMDARYYNAEVKFEDGHLKQVKAYMSGQSENALTTITFSDFGTTTIDIPTTTIDIPTVD